jgi:flagellar basal-body rod modification protein FlgD
LKLLVAQMRNQDPLNPLDNAEVTTQMAQISTVEGIEKLNTAFTRYLNQSTAVASPDNVGLVGKRVLVQGNSIDLPAVAADGARPSAQGGFELGGNVASLTVDILDGTGNVIASQQHTGLTAGVQTFTWDGATNTGAIAAPGSYQFRVRNNLPGATGPTITTLQAQPVTAVISGPNGPRLEIGGNSQLTSADIRGILQE